MIYLGIDPGLLKTGFGLIKITDYPYYLDSGYINVIKINTFSNQLKFIYSGLSEIISHYCPCVVAIEEVFVSNKTNISKTLLLIQARGTAILCAANHKLPVFQYSSRLIKQSLTGFGAANKLNLKNIVYSFLKLRYINSYDAIDAIAIALTHFVKYNKYEQ